MKLSGKVGNGPMSK